MKKKISSKGRKIQNKNSNQIEHENPNIIKRSHIHLDLLECLAEYSRFFHREWAAQKEVMLQKHISNRKRKKRKMIQEEYITQNMDKTILAWFTDLDVNEKIVVSSIQNETFLRQILLMASRRSHFGPCFYSISNSKSSTDNYTLRKLVRSQDGDIFPGPLSAIESQYTEEFMKCFRILSTNGSMDTICLSALMLNNALSLLYRWNAISRRNLFRRRPSVAQLQSAPFGDVLWGEIHFPYITVVGYVLSQMEVMIWKNFLHFQSSRRYRYPSIGFPSKKHLFLSWIHACPRLRQHVFRQIVHSTISYLDLSNKGMGRWTTNKMMMEFLLQIFSSDEVYIEKKTSEESIFSCSLSLAVKKPLFAHLFLTVWIYLIEKESCKWISEKMIQEEQNMEKNQKRSYLEPETVNEKNSTILLEKQKRKARKQKKKLKFQVQQKIEGQRQLHQILMRQVRQRYQQDQLLKKKEKEEMRQYLSMMVHDVVEMALESRELETTHKNSAIKKKAKKKKKSTQEVELIASSDDSFSIPPHLELFKSSFTSEKENFNLKKSNNKEICDPWNSSLFPHSTWGFLNWGNRSLSPLAVDDSDDNDSFSMHYTFSDVISSDGDGELRIRDVQPRGGFQSTSQSRRWFVNLEKPISISAHQSGCVSDSEKDIKPEDNGAYISATSNDKITKHLAVPKPLEQRLDFQRRRSHSTIDTRIIRDLPTPKATAKEKTTKTASCRSSPTNSEFRRGYKNCFSDQQNKRKPWVDDTVVFSKSNGQIHSKNPHCQNHKCHQQQQLLQTRCSRLECEVSSIKHELNRLQNLVSKWQQNQSRTNNDSNTYNSPSNNDLAHYRNREYYASERVAHPFTSTPIQLLTPKSKLHWDICEYVAYLQQAVENRYRARFLAQQHCVSSVVSLWPRAEVLPYGSFVTQISLPSSDVDMVICMPNVRRHNVAEAPGDLEGRNAIKETWQQNLARKLRVESWVIPESVKTIAHTSIPIISLLTHPLPSPITVYDEKGNHTTSTQHYSIQLDISFQGPGHSGLQTNQLVSNFATQYASFVPIVLVLKAFLLDRGFSTVYTGGLSSYAIVLMVVRFFQENAPTVESDNGEDLGTIFLSLLDFYGNQFDPRTTGISTNRFPNLSSPGSRRNRLWEGEETIDPHKFDPLYIEDPLFSGNNVGRNCFRIIQIRKAFASAFNTLTTSNPLPHLQSLPNAQIPINATNSLRYIIRNM